MFSENFRSRAVAPPISFCTACRALHMDWLNAMSVVALGITTAMRKGAAVTAAAIATTSTNAINKLLFIPILLSESERVQDGRRPLFLTLLIFPSFEGLVQGSRLAHPVDRYGQGGDGQQVGQHDCHARGNLHTQDLHPELQ